jgi:DNA polymerase (family 10)
MDNRTVVKALQEIAVLLEAKGESSFKVRAYTLGAERIEALEEPVARVVEEGRLRELPGIGEALAGKIAELTQTGRLAYLEKLRSELPPGVYELTQVPEIGPRKAVQLARDIGVSSVDELEAAARAGKVAGVRGFGAKTELKILEGIARLRRFRERRPIGDVVAEAAQVVEHLRGSPAVQTAIPAGSLRRFRESLADLDVVVVSPSPREAMERLAALPGATVEELGPTKASVRTASGLQVDMRVVAPDELPTALHHFTGSRGHHVRLRGLARERGLSISEYGVFREDGSKLPVASEAEIYAALGLPEIPPELREDQGELDAARAGELPELVGFDDVRGMTHCHTTWSDGENTAEEMARAARDLGFAYVTITDHSQSAHYANGLTPERLERQAEEIARAREAVPGITILHGSEVDILEDGRLDFPDAVLEKLDLVIASVHGQLGLSEDAQTRRLVAAVRHPLISWLGHPTGRLLGAREPCAVRMEEVLDAAAAAGTAVELNGAPHRLDLSAEHVRLAVKRGVKLVISADAHSVKAMSLLLGIGTARRGWATRGDVLNTLPVEAFRAALR